MDQVHTDEKWFFVTEQTACFLLAPSSTLNGKEQTVHHLGDVYVCTRGTSSRHPQE